ncbi:hypothetical protein TrST_g4169 [Triparma strigata]|uniref:WW domain-containing protein n=1 Tax=Triparma strigata TaxID=1606541 RepID=A0A9W7EYF3_9STRA|nr:hypothetical protein TrST_g4169 [Triparma strigata]
MYEEKKNDTPPSTPPKPVGPPQPSEPVHEAVDKITSNSKETTANIEEGKQGDGKVNDLKVVLSEEEQIEKELLETCAIMVQCAWRQRSAQLLCCRLSLPIIEKIYDPRSDSFYYYNVRLNTSRWYPPKFFQLSSQKIENVAPTYSRNMAGKIIQCCVRGRLGRKKVRKMLVEVVDKVHDPTTNSYYYFNRKLQITRWDKPKIWGSEDLEDYNGSRSKQQKERERRNTKQNKGRRQSVSQNRERPETGDSEMEEYRPKTGESEWSETDVEGDEGDETETDVDPESRPNTTGTEIMEAVEEDSEDEAEADLGEYEEDEEGDSSDEESKEESLSLAPRRFPRSRMQFLIDQAEDKAREIRHMPIPKSVGPSPLLNDGGEGDASRPASAKDEGAGSRPGTKSSSRPGSSKPGSRPGTATKKEAAKEEQEQEEEEKEKEQVDEPARTFSLNLSHFKAKKISGRIYDLGSTLMDLDISNNRLTRISPDMGELLGLVKLNISNNKILKLPAELEDLTALTHLDMSHNLLRTYPPTLYKLPLIYWDVSFNQLSDIPVEVGNLQLLRETKEWEVGIGIVATLVHYNAGHNRLEKWPEQLNRCKDLEFLDLSHNYIKDIADEAKENVNLKTVNLEKNRLLHLPSTVNEWVKLEYLNVATNRIESFPDDLTAWSNELKELIMDNNQLDSIPKSFNSLIELVKLSCENNAIRSIDVDAAASWSNLRHINVDNNLLKGLPPNLHHWHQLNYISCRKNKLADLPKELCQLFKLEELHFGDNKIKELDASLGMLMSVHIADFSKNKLEVLPAEFFRMVGLKVLDLSRNSLLSLPYNVAKLKLLENLDLTRNNLCEIPNEICELKALKTLKLGHNKLMALPDDMYYLTDLRTVQIDHNLFNNKPPQYDLMKGVVSFNMSSNPMNDHRSKHVHRDALIRLASNVESKLVMKKVNKDSNIAPFLEDIDNAKAAVKAYDLQRAKWKTIVGQSGYKYDEEDSSATVAPGVDYRHYFRLGVFQMRLGMSYLKKIERVKNGGLTDEENAAQEEIRKKERKERVKESLALATGAKPVSRPRTDSMLKEIVVDEQDSDDDNNTVQTDQSFMTKQRIKEQEMEEAIAPIFSESKKCFKDAVDSLSHSLELYISSNKPGDMLNHRGPNGDLTTGVEIYYSRGRCKMLMNDFSEAIKDFNLVLDKTPFHVPSLMLRGNSRICLGQFPQARRDFAKILNRIDTEHRLAEELRDECDDGIERLSHAGICKPEDEQGFEVTSEGVRIRDRVEYKKLAMVGRSLKRFRMDSSKAKKQFQVDMQKQHDAEREKELEFAHKRASVAMKKVENAKKLRLEAMENRMEMERKHKEDQKRRREAKLRKIEEDKEKKELAFMRAEEDLMRQHLMETIISVNVQQEEFKKDDEDIDALLAAAGRGKSRGKGRGGAEDRPWSKPGIPKMKKKTKKKAKKKEEEGGGGEEKK